MNFDLGGAGTAPTLRTRISKVAACHLHLRRKDFFQRQRRGLRPFQIFWLPGLPAPMLVSSVPRAWPPAASAQGERARAPVRLATQRPRCIAFARVGGCRRIRRGLSGLAQCGRAGLLGIIEGRKLFCTACARGIQARNCRGRRNIVLARGRLDAVSPRRASRLARDAVEPGV